jgi:excisionase family DNA binding protein
MLTVAEAASLLRVSRATVYKLVAEGRLPHVRIGNQIRFLRSSPQLCVNRTSREAPRMNHAALATATSFDFSRDMSR